MYKNILYIILFFSFISNSYSQGFRDSSVFIPMIRGSFNYQFPGGDLADRFGNNLGLTPGFMFKTKSKILIGAEIEFIFGEDVNKGTIFDPITTSEGSVITKYGNYSRIALSERGFFVQGRVGAMIKQLGPNPNCGFYFLGGVGLLQHKIRIDVDGNDVPQLDENYKKGYDRLSNGLAISEAIGYQFFHNRSTWNFYIELEFIQAFTESRRDFDYNIMQKDDTKRKDYLYGIKFGWILPFYKRVPENYYYY